MKGGSKTFAGVVALLVALALSACGGGSSGNGTTSTDGTTSAEAGKEQVGGGGGAESAEREGEAAEFTPKQHHDSGGGSQQYIQKGGDNSVQEFGKEADPQELEAAAAALHGFLDARAEGNWGATCGYVSTTIVESFEKLVAQTKKLKDASCAGVLEKLINPAVEGQLKEEAEVADVGSLRVEGERSFIIYRGIKGTILAMPMADENGRWKVASLSGAPLN